MRLVCPIHMCGFLEVYTNNLFLISWSIVVFDYFYLYYRTSLLQGFNATLTEPANTQGVRGGHIRELQSRLHPEIKETLKKLCDDRRTNIVILSGSDRAVLDDVFSYL